MSTRCCCCDNTTFSCSRGVEWVMLARVNNERTVKGGPLRLPLPPPPPLPLPPPPLPLLPPSVSIRGTCKGANTAPSVCMIGGVCIAECPRVVLMLCTMSNCDSSSRTKDCGLWAPGWLEGRYFRGRVNHTSVPSTPSIRWRAPHSPPSVRDVENKVGGGGGVYSERVCERVS